MNKPRVLLAINRHRFPSVLSPEDLERLRSLADVINDDPPADIDKNFLLKHAPSADVVLSSWDTAPFDADVLAAAPHLKLVCHAAGTVRPIVTDALWKRGIRVTSAASAIAYGVAEFCLGLILMASKRVFWLSQGTARGEWMEGAPGFGGMFELYRQNVGIIGAGHIGKHLIRLFRNFDCHVFVYDPYLSDGQADELGCKKLETLEELFGSCCAVSLNAPSNEGTRGMLRGRHFALLPKGAVFVNTAGSIQIHEAEFVEELRKGHFVACVDRCEVEPCALDHPYRTLPNVILTPHIAGATRENLLRIGTYVVDEVEAFTEGKKLIYEVTEKTLATMA